MTRPAKPTQLCCVSIGHMDLIMPADKGMKLLELMQHAVHGKQDFDRTINFQTTYVLGEQPRVEFSLLKPNQVIPGAGHEIPTTPRRSGPRLLK